MTLNSHARAAAALVAALALSLPLAVAPASAQPQAGVPLTSQSSSERGVTVKVTPKAIAPDNPRWEFSVVLDTHSGDLSDDLMQTATLVTSDGRELKPIAWTGAGPGGHHREGVLEFSVPAPWPSAIELKVERAGESVARVFRWQL
ncbi:hypothetical protein [Piscinibacter sp.]|jgi:hypothetical protein|uniref:hypothetical protein n=1 Tax=Piscinibacter sp. TaxID=1903157 RepID=UPI002F414866